MHDSHGASVCRWACYVCVCVCACVGDPLSLSLIPWGRGVHPGGGADFLIGRTPDSQIDAQPCSPPPPPRPRRLFLTWFRPGGRSEAGGDCRKERGVRKGRCLRSCGRRLTSGRGARLCLRPGGPLSGHETHSVGATITYFPILKLCFVNGRAEKWTFPQCTSP